MCTTATSSSSFLTLKKLTPTLLPGSSSLPSSQSLISNAQRTSIPSTLTLACSTESVVPTGSLPETLTVTPLTVLDNV